MTPLPRRSRLRGSIDARVADGLSTGLMRMTRRGLRGIWVRGELPAGRVVWAANHHSWWDPFVAHAVLRAADRPAALLMDPDNLEEFGLVRRLGVVGTPRAALDALRADRVLVVFPEGELRPASALGATRPGAAWLARRAEATLVSAAVRLTMRGHEAPEAYIDLTTVADPDALPDVLTERLRLLDDELVRADPREPLPGFVRTLAGRLSWDERLQRLGPVRRA